MTNIVGTDATKQALNLGLEVINAGQPYKNAVGALYNKAVANTKTPDEALVYIFREIQKDAGRNDEDSRKVALDALTVAALRKQITEGQQNNLQSITFHYDELYNGIFAQAREMTYAADQAEAAGRKAAFEATLTPDQLAVKNLGAGDLVKECVDRARQFKDENNKSLGLEDTVERLVNIQRTNAWGYDKGIYDTAVTAIRDSAVIEAARNQQQQSVTPAAPVEVVAGTPAAPTGNETANNQKQTAAKPKTTSHHRTDFSAVAALDDDAFVEKMSKDEVKLTKEDPGQYKQDAALVKKAQALLGGLDVDGKFGKLTDARLIAFKTEHKLTDGQGHVSDVIDAQTVAALRIEQLAKLAKPGEDGKVSDEQQAAITKELARVNRVGDKLSDESKKELAAILPTLPESITKAPEGTAAATLYKTALNTTKGAGRDA